jgi:glycosyltransferase involved in cell wall biosynthesis
LDGALFLQQQGPACAGLLEALQREQDVYDAVVFFTALYQPTAEGLPLWGRRSVLIPTLHDEKPMYLPCFHRVFAAAGAVLYNTSSEQRLARLLYGRSAPMGEVVGADVEVVTPTDAQMREVRARHGLPQAYLVCVGRIEKGKGCADLLAAWLAVQAGLGEAALVFVGKGEMPVPTSAQVRRTGFVSNADRDALIAGAAALVVPSRYESLSLVLLEAWALGVPVLANDRCEVLSEHLRVCPAGEVYRGSAALREGLRRALARTAEQRREMGELGRQHVAATYGREIVTSRWLTAIERVCELPSASINR